MTMGRGSGLSVASMWPEAMGREISSLCFGRTKGEKFPISLSHPTGNAAFREMLYP